MKGILAFERVGMIWVLACLLTGCGGNSEPAAKPKSPSSVDTKTPTRSTARPAESVRTAALADETDPAGENTELAEMRRRLDSGVSPSKSDEMGFSLLGDAVASRRVDVARLLCGRGAKVNPRDQEIGWTPLHWASCGGRVELAQLLIERGADVKSTDKRSRTPLHIAAANDAEVARLLISAGADVNARDALGQTPLHGAARAGSVWAVRLLLENGAEVEAKNHNGQTAMFLAMVNGNTQIIKLLEKHGAATIDLASLQGAGKHSR